jgi:hypothetical protein
MLRGGHQVTDIAVLYPIESLWTKFVPAYCGATHAKKATRLDRLFEKVSSQLYHTNYDFSYIDVQALCEASVRRGRLKHGDLCWRVLILPDVDTLPIDAWETIERFWRKGGTIVSIGDYPLNSADEFPSERVQTIARKLFGAREQQIGWETNKVGVWASFSRLVQRFASSNHRFRFSARCFLYRPDRSGSHHASTHRSSRHLFAD